MTAESKLSFDEFIRHWAVDRADIVALEQGDETITFGELEPYSRKVVAMLIERGVGKGDRIAWLGKNAIDYFVLFYSAARLGAVMVPIGWRLAAPEVAYILGDTKASLLFVGDGFCDLAQKAAAQLDAPATL